MKALIIFAVQILNFVVQINGQNLELTAEPSVREPILDLYVGDAPNDYFSILNATSIPGKFAPMINGHNGSDDRTALYLLAGTLQSNDVVNDDFPIMVFDSRISPQPYQLNLGDHLPLNNRILFGWHNTGESKMALSADGNLGIGVKSPKAKVHIADGDIYLQDIGRGIIMKSPDGNCWRVSVDNGGSLDSSSVGCP